MKTKQKKRVPNKNIDVKDIVTYEYIQDYNIIEMRNYFGTGSNRINQTLREKK